MSRAIHTALLHGVCSSNGVSVTRRSLKGPSLLPLPSPPDADSLLPGPRPAVEKTVAYQPWAVHFKGYSAIDSDEEGPVSLCRKL